MWRDREERRTGVFSAVDVQSVSLLPFLAAAQILCCRQVGFTAWGAFSKGAEAALGVWLVLPTHWAQRVENIMLGVRRLNFILSVTGDDVIKVGCQKVNLKMVFDMRLGD